MSRLIQAAFVGVAFCGGLSAQVRVSDSAGDDYLVIDNSLGAPAYQELSGTYGQDSGQPDSWNGDRRWSNSGGTGTTARWTFASLPNGTWTVYASWRNIPQGNLTTAAPFTVSDGLGVVAVDMRAGNTGDLVLEDGDGRSVEFQELGTVLVSDGDLQVTLNDDASISGATFVFADAIAVGPIVDDADGDGMPDDWEEANGLDRSVDDSAGDPDGDTLSNLEEFERGTSPQLDDTDQDGLLDSVEDGVGSWNGTSAPGTDPLNPDTDGDGLLDGVENPDLPFAGPLQSGTDPNVFDGDGDGYSDGVEVNAGSDPTDQNSLPPVVATSPDLSFNEIHYDPDGATSRTEFLEILNHGTSVVDLAGWQIDGGVDFVLPSTVIGPGERVVVAQDPAAMLSRYGITCLGPWDGKLSNEGEEIVLRDGSGQRIDEVSYGVGFPWPSRSRGGGSSMELVSAEVDNDLGGAWRSSVSVEEGTPGAVNSVFGMNVPPLVRQVKHLPEQPGGSDPVVVSAKVTDDEGVSSVILEYQIVEPGAYVRLQDSSFETNWTSVAMNDDGQNGDALAGDDLFSQTLPAAGHRRLVRYRMRVTDSASNELLVPYADDPQPNFAYFCYDGVPAWEAANRPGVTGAETFGEEVMRGMPAYHLLATATDIERSQYQSAFRGVRFRGTLVYDGRVYDHIEFNNRGEASTYRTGKNKWRFRFNRTHEFEARDNFGRKYEESWSNMKVNGGTAPWNYINRGMAGVDECLTYRMFELAGVPASRTSYFQLRVIDGSDEAGANQYAGDLWGLYFSVEIPNGDFLDERDLPDGNLYKMENPPNQDNQGADEPIGPADYNAIRSQMSTARSESWWRENVDHLNYARYKAVAEGVTHYDQRDGMQGYYYHNPATGKWMLLPWDCDTMFQLTPKYYTWDRFRICLDDRYSTNALEGRNEQREVLDLLFNERAVDAVMGEFIDRVNPSGQSLTWSDVDQFVWNYHPRTPGVFQGGFNVLTGSSNPAGVWYSRTLISADHEGQMDFIRKFMQPGGYGYDNLVAEVEDPAIPNTPVISYQGVAGFPTDSLVFETSFFSDPGGIGTFGALEWRVGEVADGGPTEPPIYEVNAVWESGEQTTFSTTQAVPPGVLRPGSTYRARVRHQDQSGRWSHWSEPLEFMAGQPDVAPYLAGLVISEVMYHPASDGELEFIELMNVGAVTLSLSPLRFVDGVEFDFGVGSIQSLEPGERVLVVGNQAVFESVYGTQLPVTGEFVSGALSNGGERLELAFGEDTILRQFTYDDSFPWPESADGGGGSLVLIAPARVPDHDDAFNWRASISAGGNPGMADAIPYQGGDLLEYALAEAPIFDPESGSYTVRLNPGADDVEVTPEWSVDLRNWQGTGWQLSGREPDQWTIAAPQDGKLFVRLLVKTRP